jgi:hypothetical protein
MKPYPGPQSCSRERGAALLLSFLILMVIISIVYQLTRVTGTDQQVAEKTLQLTKMESAIRSAMLEVLEQLRQDGELRLGGGGDGGGAGGDAGGDPGGDPGDPGGEAVADGEEGAGESNPDAVDCQMDEWAQVAATTIDEVNLRIYIEDEDRKYNILNMLVEDPEMAEDAYDRVARILDLCREGTTDDITNTKAEEMARVMRDHMLERENSLLPRPLELLNDDEDNTSLGLPLTMREFLPLKPFADHHFRDRFDADEVRVHAITAYLTCYTSPSTGGDNAVRAEGGFNVNLNTAPLAVLSGLFDSRDVDGRFWDEVLQYRNKEEEVPRGEEEPEEVLDEFGEPVIRKQFFDSVDELSELPDWDGFDPELRGKVEKLLRVDSDVFTITITARVSTADENLRMQEFKSRHEQEMYERSGVHLVRTVRAVYWRQMGDDSVEMVPLVPWEVIDYAPLPVLDLPENY